MPTCSYVTCPSVSALSPSVVQVTAWQLQSLPVCQRQPSCKTATLSPPQPLLRTHRASMRPCSQDSPRQCTSGQQVLLSMLAA